MPIWVRPDKPDWIVPSRSGDKLLRKLAGGARADLDLLDRAAVLVESVDVPSAPLGHQRRLHTPALELIGQRGEKIGRPGILRE